MSRLIFLFYESHNTPKTSFIHRFIMWLLRNVFGYKYAHVELLFTNNDLNDSRPFIIPNKPKYLIIGINFKDRIHILDYTKFKPTHKYKAVEINCTMKQKRDFMSSLMQKINDNVGYNESMYWRCGIPSYQKKKYHCSGLFASCLIDAGKIKDKKHSFYLYTPEKFDACLAKLGGKPTTTVAHPQSQNYNYKNLIV